MYLYIMYKTMHTFGGSDTNSRIFTSVGSRDMFPPYGAKPMISGCPFGQCSIVRRDHCRLISVTRVETYVNDARVGNNRK